MYPIHNVSARVLSWRRRPIVGFVRVFQPDAATRILDVGGLPSAWDNVPTTPQFTLRNFESLDDYSQGFVNPLYAFDDGTCLPCGKELGPV